MVSQRRKMRQPAFRVDLPKTRSGVEEKDLADAINSDAGSRMSWSRCRDQAACED